MQRDIPFHEVDGETLTLDCRAAAFSGPTPSPPSSAAARSTSGDKGEFARHALDLAADGFRVFEPRIGSHRIGRFRRRS